MGINIDLSQEAAIILADMLTSYFYAGWGPLAGRLSKIQAAAASELLIRIEDHRSASPLYLGEMFEEALGAAEAVVGKQIE